MILEQLSSSESEEQDINTYCYPDKIVTRVVQWPVQCRVSIVCSARPSGHLSSWAWAPLGLSPAPRQRQALDPESLHFTLVCINW